MSKLLLITMWMLVSILTVFCSNNDETNKFDVGEAVQIVKFIDGKPECDNENLIKVFQQKESKGLPAIIISMAGIQGIGKSFLLNFFSRFLEFSQHKSPLTSIEQLINFNKDLSGFEWKNRAFEGGTTSGIFIWSVPFILKSGDTICSTGDTAWKYRCVKNQKVAVFLMDTQGSHDTLTKSMNNAIVYSLSTFISSIQIFNIKNKVNANDLNHLAQYSFHGKEVPGENYSVKQFQKLIFLIRDWSSAHTYPYGLKGGESYLKDVIMAESKIQEVQSDKSNIKKCYATINCFLMPHPGDHVAQARDSKDFNANKMSGEFSNELLNLMKWIFSKEIINSENVKKVNGITISSDDIPIYFNAYFEDLLKFNGNFESINDFNSANIRASNWAAYKRADLYYTEGMKEMLGLMSRWIDSKFIEIHNENYIAAIQVFRQFEKLGDDVIHNEFEKKLNDTLTESFNLAKHTRDNNKATDIFIAKTAFITLVAGGGYKFSDKLKDVILSKQFKDILAKITVAAADGALYLGKASLDQLKKILDDPETLLKWKNVILSKDVKDIFNKIIGV